MNGRPGRRHALGRLAGAVAGPGLSEVGSAIAGFGTGSLAALAALGTPRSATAHGSVGPIRPAQAAPPVTVVTHAGDRLPLRDLLGRRPAAVQLMFTGCSAACPLQGALFAQLEAALDALDPAAPAAALQLVSLSIDPLSDDPTALRQWLARFGAGRRWTAAAPVPDALDRLLAFLNGRASGTDPHNTQLAVFDARGRFVWRTGDLPPPASIVRLADEIARG